MPLGETPNGTDGTSVLPGTELQATPREMWRGASFGPSDSTFRPHEAEERAFLGLSWTIMLLVKYIASGILWG